MRGQYRLPRFRRQIRDHLCVLLSRSHLSFPQILRRSLNCDPSELSLALDELEGAGAVCAQHDSTPNAVSYCLRTSESRRRSAPAQHGSIARPVAGPVGSRRKSYFEAFADDMLRHLPEPTPIYSQWWFLPSSYSSLVTLLVRTGQANSPAAFLGCGTLGAAFSRVRTTPVTLLDVDQELLRSLEPFCSSATSLVHYDVSDHPDGSLLGKHGLVVVDPPWSRRLLPLFLARGASLVSVGGSLAISFPQSFTRPGILHERRELIRLAGSLGLRLERVIARGTRYAVPPFERAAYGERGIHIKCPWRAGDLFVFRSVAHLRRDPWPAPVGPSPRWDQFRAGNWRLFLNRDGHAEAGPPRLRSVAGLARGVCPTVSSRAQYWDDASLVCTRNRMAIAEGRDQLSLALQRLFTAPGGGSSRHAVSDISRFSSVSETMRDWAAGVETMLRNEL